MRERARAPAAEVLPDPRLSTAQALFDYHRTIIGYHGTHRKAATSLVNGAAFAASENDDDWLGHGIYFWEYAPQQAWSWARRRYGERHAAVIGAMIRLGRCLDLLDPANVGLLKEAHAGLESDLKSAGLKPPRNANTHKYLDCAVFRHLYHELDELGYVFQSCRAVFVPMERGKIPRLWERSGVLAAGHIQVCVREAANILAVWPVRRDGHYGKD
jgi:hypothetical protein